MTELTSNVVKLEHIEGKLIIIHGESVLLDSDVADIQCPSEIMLDLHLNEEKGVRDSVTKCEL